MARPKGLPKTGGKKKGSRNKVTLEKAKAIEASGLTPLDYMLSLLRDELNDTETRFEAAKAAAPYCHNKLASVEHTGKDGGPIETVNLSDLERAQALALLLGKLKGR